LKQETRFYCYIYYRKDGTTPFYVGKGSRKRALDFSAHRNSWAKSIIKKDGRDCVRIELIPCEEEHEAFKLETHWIHTFRSDGYTLCNFTDGGEGPSGYKLSEETKQRMRDKIISLEARQNMSKFQKGKIKSEEHKRKISLSEKGKIVLAETRQKISTANTGKKCTEEHKQKNRVALSGDKSNSAKLTWNQINNIKNNYSIFNISQKELASWYGMSQGAIYNIISNKSWKETNDTN